MKICDRNIHPVTETYTPATLSSMNVSHIRGVEPKKPELAECTPWDSIYIKCDNSQSTSTQSDVHSDSGYPGVGVTGRG